MTSSKFNL